MMNVYYGCYCEAKTDFEPLYFKLANYEFKVSPENYIVETRSSRKRFCYFLMQGSNVRNIILGDSFLRNYYIYHDVTNKKMGLYGDHMLFSRPETFTIELAYVIVAIAAFLTCLSSAVIYYCCVYQSSRVPEKVPLFRRGAEASESMNQRGNC
jgi:hypothetical protein